MDTMLALHSDSIVLFHDQAIMHVIRSGVFVVLLANDENNVRTLFQLLVVLRCFNFSNNIIFHILRYYKDKQIRKQKINS